jgi:hypothetical protein
MSNDIKAPVWAESASRTSTAVRGTVQGAPELTTGRELRLGRQQTLPGLSGGMILTAIVEAFRKLDPRTLWRNPVMFVVEIVSLITTILVIRDAVAGVSVLFSAQITF